MKIAQLTPGSGDNFYCENCLRDAAMVRAVRANGHDMLMIPMYLPLQTERDQELVNAPLFFGGINVYLQQKMGFFRKTPRWLDKMLDSPKLLEWVAKKSSMTSAKDLAVTTISMLKGEHGNQIKELDRLVDWLAKDENRPDVVCLSNLLLAGIAKRIKEVLKVPVVSLLQDEDGFIDGLGGVWADKAWGILKERCDDIDGFISVSKYYAGQMKQRLELPDEKVHVVRMGVDLEMFKGLPVEAEVPTIGFLSRMCEGKGLDILVDAFIYLKKKEGLENLRLRVSGGKSGTDETFIREQKVKIVQAGFESDAEFIEEFGLESKKEFFRGLSVLAVPARQETAYGLFVIESFAAGVPVVEPETGVFDELVFDSGAGVLYQPNTYGLLAENIEPILRDERMRLLHSTNGKKAAAELFDVRKSAVELVELLERITK